MVKWGHIIYGGVNSADYGIYITGEAVYNAPERDVEYVEVPGRNGAITIDNGRFRNITVTYPAGAFGSSQKEYREKMARFRNAILSQKGYQRLEDAYNPDEYRMGVYASGLEVSPVSHGRAGEFNLVFECKPQRFLTVGDYPIPLDSGDIIQNPTPFDSGPLLEITGYGNILLNNTTIGIDIPNVPLGVVNLPLSGDHYLETTADEQQFDLTLDDSLLNANDNLWFAPYNDNPFLFNITLIGDSSVTGSDLPTSISVTNNTNNSVWYASLNTDKVPYEINISFAFDAQYNFKYGTYNQSKTIVFGIDVTIAGTSYSLPVGVTVYYNGTDTERVVFDAYNLAQDPDDWPIKKFIYQMTNLEGFFADSSDVVSGNIVIDCEYGEAYKVVGNSMVNLNSVISFGSELPVLYPGANKITFSNTITDFKLTPRWWKI